MEWRKALSAKSCSIRSARASASRMGTRKPSMPSRITEPALGRVITGRPEAMASRAESAMPSARVGSTNRSARRNSCCTWLRGNRSEIGGAQERGSLTFTSCGPTTRHSKALWPFACNRRQAAASTWLPLRRPTCPTISSRPGWGFRLQRQTTAPARHRARFRSRARSQPQRHGALQASGLTAPAPDHTKLHFSRVRLRSLATESLPGRGVRCRDSGVAHRAAAGRRAGSRNCSCTTFRPHALAWRRASRSL